MGCRLTIVEDLNSEKGYIVQGNSCKKGGEYGIKEIINPTRVLTSTVKIKKAHLERMPVVTKGGIPKDKMFECMKEINSVEIEAPVKVGDIIIENILNTGINLVASRSMNRI